MTLHPCAAPGCPHQTLFTWCSAVHSPRTCEHDHHERPQHPEPTPDPAETP